MSTTNSIPRLLLLIPALPSDHSDLANGIIGDTIKQVLQEAAAQSADFDEAVPLEIALACPEFCSEHESNINAVIGEAQKNLSALYGAIGLIAAHNDINVEDSTGVDVRVILVAWSAQQNTTRSRSLYGPIISLQALASPHRSWDFAFAVESEDGQAFMQAFLSAKGATSDTRSLEDHAKGTSSAAPRIGNVARGYGHVAVGGTFDHLHIGHKLLLTITLLAVTNDVSAGKEQSVTIGITGDKLLVNKKYAGALQSWQERQRQVGVFVDSVVNFGAEAPQILERNEDGPNGKSVDLHYPHRLTIKCTEIQDAFGPTITDEHIAALIISGETRSGGDAVNAKRVEKGWRALEVFEVDVLHVTEDVQIEADFKGKISSTEIRRKILQKSSVTTG